MRLFAAAAMLLFAAPVTAGDFEPNCEAVGGFIEGIVEDGRTVGASALVWHRGEEACFVAAGDAVREEGRRFARDTLIQVFSMTKPVTGVALIQLWEKGKVGLDDPLEWYLPEYAETEVLTGETDDGEALTAPPKRKITVRDVLRHTAGFSYGP